jgi:hypothetical protein
LRSNQSEEKRASRKRASPSNFASRKMTEPTLLTPVKSASFSKTTPSNET